MNTPSAPAPPSPEISPVARNVLEQLPDHAPHLHHATVEGPETYQPYETPPIPARISEDVVSASEQIMARVNAISGHEQLDLGPYERTEKIGRIKGFLGKIANAAGGPEALEKRAKKLELEAQAEEALAQYAHEIATGQKTAFILPEGAPAKYHGKALEIRRKMYEVGKKQQKKQEQIEWTHDSTGSGRFRYNGGLQITGEVGDRIFTESQEMSRATRGAGVANTRRGLRAARINNLSYEDQQLLKKMRRTRQVIPEEELEHLFDKFNKVTKSLDEDEAANLEELKKQNITIRPDKLDGLYRKLEKISGLTQEDKELMQKLRDEQRFFSKDEITMLEYRLEHQIARTPLNSLERPNGVQNASKNPAGPSSPLHYWKVKRAQLNWDRSGSIQKPAEQLTVDEYREKEQEIGPRPIMDIYSPSLAMQRIDRISDPTQRDHELAMLNKIQRLRDGTVADYSERLAMARGDKQHERAANARAKAAKARRAAQRLERWDEVGEDLATQRKRHKVDSAFEGTQAVEDHIVRFAQRASRKASEGSNTGAAVRAVRDLTSARLPLPKDSWLEGRARKEIKKLQESEVLAKSRRGEALTDKEQEKLRIVRRERRQAQARLDAVLRRKTKKSAREKVTTRKIGREKRASQDRGIVRKVRRTAYRVNVEATKDPNTFRDSLSRSPRRGYESQTRRILSTILTDPRLTDKSALTALANLPKKKRQEKVKNLKIQAEKQQNRDLLK